jgi:hypothetical protein
VRLDILHDALDDGESLEIVRSDVIQKSRSEEMNESFLEREESVSECFAFFLKQ